MRSITSSDATVIANISISSVPNSTEVPSSSSNLSVPSIQHEQKNKEKEKQHYPHESSRRTELYSAWEKRNSPPHASKLKSRAKSRVSFAKGALLAWVANSASVNALKTQQAATTPISTDLLNLYDYRSESMFGGGKVCTRNLEIEPLPEELVFPNETFRVLHGSGYLAKIHDYRYASFRIGDGIFLPLDCSQINKQQGIQRDECEQRGDLTCAEYQQDLLKTMSKDSCQTVDPDMKYNFPMFSAVQWWNRRDRILPNADLVFNGGWFDVRGAKSGTGAFSYRSRPIPYMEPCSDPNGPTFINGKNFTVTHNAMTANGLDGGLLDSLMIVSEARDSTGGSRTKLVQAGQAEELRRTRADAARQGDELSAVSGVLMVKDGVNTNIAAAASPESPVARTVLATGYHHEMYIFVLQNGRITRDEERINNTTVHYSGIPLGFVRDYLRQNYAIRDMIALDGSGSSQMVAKAARYGASAAHCPTIVDDSGEVAIATYGGDVRDDKIRHRPIPLPIFIAGES